MMIGMPTMRDKTSHCRSGLPTTAKTKMATTMTTSRKPVPQRGCIGRIVHCTLRVGAAVGLVRMDDLVLGPVVLEDPAQVGYERDAQDVDEKHDYADDALHQVEHEGVVKGLLEGLTTTKGMTMNRPTAERDGYHQSDRQLLPSERGRLRVRPSRLLAPAGRAPGATARVRVPVSPSDSTASSATFADMPRALTPRLSDSNKATTPLMTGILSHRWRSPAEVSGYEKRAMPPEGLRTATPHE